MHLSIIIPLYNEKDLVIHLLDQLISVKYPEFVQHFEIIIIDDCSTDNSYQLVKEYIAEKQNFKLFKHTANKGKGAAVRTGIGNAKGDVYLIQDADLELSPSDIPAMLITMEKMKVQFVNGSRYLPGV